MVALKAWLADLPWLCQAAEPHSRYIKVTERHLITRKYRVRSVDRETT